MPHDPLHDIAEILGEPADSMHNPANAYYLCPFKEGACSKSSHSFDVPYPVCSIYRRGRRGTPPPGPPICVCPNRFLEAQILDDVIRECWVGEPPLNPVLVSEVSMERFGKVDFVVADLNDAGTQVRDFISVELQAVDITGSCLPSYEAIIHNRDLPARPAYGFNWANVRKRFISQLVAKGFHHHHWGTRIVAVMQEDVFAEFHRHAAIPAVGIDQANIVFLLYQFDRQDGRWEMRFRKAIPTTHVQVMTAALYERPLARAEFEARIISRL